MKTKTEEKNSYKNSPFHKLTRLVNPLEANLYNDECTIIYQQMIET